MDLPNVVWKLQRTNDFSSKNAKSIIESVLPVVDPFVLLSEKLNMVIVLSSRQSWIDQKVAVVVF